MRKLILIFLLACSACSTQAQDPGGKPARSGAAAGTADSSAPAAGGDTLARIRALIGPAACTESGQCRTLPVGALACGGPQAYLPYAMSGTDEKTLLALAEQYKAERMAHIKGGGMASICRHLPDPGAVCTRGACQLGAAAPAAVAR